MNRGATQKGMVDKQLANGGRLAVSQTLMMSQLFLDKKEAWPSVIKQPEPNNVLAQTSKQTKLVFIRLRGCLTKLCLTMAVERTPAMDSRG